MRLLWAHALKDNDFKAVYIAPIKVSLATYNVMPGCDHLETHDYDGFVVFLLGGWSVLTCSMHLETRDVTGAGSVQ